MKPFELHDQRHLDAAQGWFELGNCIEATEELDQITPEMRGHPSVLEVRFHIYAAAKKWEYAAQRGQADRLRELQGQCRCDNGYDAERTPASACLDSRWAALVTSAPSVILTHHPFNLPQFQHPRRL